MSSLLNRHQMAWRAAQDIPDGAYVNLGIGIPVLAANHIVDGREVLIQSENGLLGMGPQAADDAADPDLVDASGNMVTLRTGAAIFDSSSSFLMITGGHIDMTLLGAFQVAANGDLANWDMMRPERGPLVGGAMDLAAGAKSVRVIMEHVTREGDARLVAECSYPLTAKGVVDRIYTNMAVIDVTPEGFVAREIIAGMDIATLAAKTGAPLLAAPDCGILSPPALSS
jgi:3-oxoadipate CoA-transferase, beta subunit